MIYLRLIIVLISAELSLRVIVFLFGNNLREFPKTSSKELKRFKNYDSILGWEPKPSKKSLDSIFKNTEGYNNSISINVDGSRGIPIKINLNLNNLDNKLNFEFFGDSSCFCREVADHETLQYYMEKDFSINSALNFGVGNYGIDQAFLRAKKVMKGKSIIILYFPVSSLPRITTVYKHYSEYGNFWAIKPRFIIDESNIKLIERPFSNIDELLHLKKYKDYFRFYDEFYLNWSKKKIDLSIPLIFQLGKLFCFFYRITRPIIYGIFKKMRLISFLKDLRAKVTKQVKGDESSLSGIAEQSSGYLGDLFALICSEFQSLAISKKSIFYVAFSPQGSYNDYYTFLKIYDNLKSKFRKYDLDIKIINIGRAFEKLNIEEIEKANTKSVHLSPYGNYLVAKYLSGYFNSMKMK